MNQKEYKTLISHILYEHNKIRNDPQSYIDLIKDQMKYIKGNYLQLPGEVPVYTFEGKKAFEEAIEYLSKRKPVDNLTFDENLSQASEDHVRDIGPRGSVDIISSNGDDLSSRIERYCEWENICAENINFGSKTAEEVIISLVIDDGFTDREHRENLFNEEIKLLGIYSGNHKEFKYVTVLTYVGGIRPKNKTYFDKSTMKYPYPPEINQGRFKKLVNKFSDNQVVEKKVNFYDKLEPEEYESVTISKILKKCNDKDVLVEKKIFKLKDNTSLIVEKEFI